MTQTYYSSFYPNPSGIGIKGSTITPESGNITTRWPNLPPIDANIGDLYFDEFNVIYRFEGASLLLNGEVLLLNGETITASGWVLAQDQLIPELETAVQASIADLAAVMANFETRNDLNGTIPVAPIIASDGSAFNHTINTNGSANIIFTWTFPVSSESTIDGFQIVTYSSSTKIDAAPGSQVTEMVHPIIRSSNRSFTLYGVNPLDYYSIAIRSIRVVDPSIDPDRLMNSVWVRSNLIDERPYRPSTELSIAGVTGANDLAQKSWLEADFNGYKKTPFSYSTWYDVSNGTTTLQASITSSQQDNQTVLIDALLFLDGDGGSNDNLDIRCSRNDGVILSKVYENIQIANVGARPYTFKFFDADVPKGVTVTYKIQWLARPSDGHPYWHDVSIVIDALKR